MSVAITGGRMSHHPIDPGLRDELITEELAELLRDAADRTAARDLEPSETLERLGKHLLRVARRLRAPRPAPPHERRDLMHLVRTP